MTHLTPEQLEELTDELRRQLERLLRSMRVTEANVEPVKLDQTAVGRLSRIDSLQNQSMAQNLQERERIKLAHIEGALRRLEDDTYGLCVTCDAEIPFGRLYAMPESPTCAGCGGTA